MNRHFEEATAGTDPGFISDREVMARLDAKFDQLEAKIDAWFNFQYLLIAVLGVLILFDDPIRSTLGF